MGTEEILVIEFQRHASPGYSYNRPVLYNMYQRLRKRNSEYSSIIVHGKINFAPSQKLIKT